MVSGLIIVFQYLSYIALQYLYIWTIVVAAKQLPVPRVPVFTCAPSTTQTPSLFAKLLKNAGGEMRGLQIKH